MQHEAHAGGLPAARGKADTGKTAKGSLMGCQPCANGESEVYPERVLGTAYKDVRVPFN